MPTLSLNFVGRFCRFHFVDLALSPDPNATERNRTIFRARPDGARPASVAKHRTKRNDFNKTERFDHVVPTTYDNSFAGRSILACGIFSPIIL
jgi:hypothetical protein